VNAVNAVNTGGERSTFTAAKMRHEIVYRAVNDLAPYAGNAREHSAGQIKKLAAMIGEFGFNVPVLLEPDGTIVAGHGRLLAAKSLGLVEVPTINLGHLTPAQRRAYRLADNRIALESKWNDELLAKELAAVAAEGALDLALTGFDDAEVEKLLADATGAAAGRSRDPDAAPAPVKLPTTRAGDMWQLGPHRLICGDCTDAETVRRVLAGEKPNLMVTDPPYGVNYDPNWRNGTVDAAGVVRGKVGARAVGKVSNDDRADWRDAWRLFPGAVAYVWHGGLHGGTVEASLVACSFKVRAQVVWVKTRPVISRGAYHWQHEPALYAVQDGADDNWRFVPEHEVAAYAVLDGKTADWHGGRRQSTVWFIEHLKSDTGHGTQKPVECMRRPIINNSERGDAVYEPFSGSGTTIIAAEMTGRRCLACELDPSYVDVAVRRWQEFVGAAATLAGDGRTFAQVAAERAAAVAA
jgi:DNA modification methylase